MVHVLCALLYNVFAGLQVFPTLAISAFLWEELLVKLPGVRVSSAALDQASKNFTLVF